MLGDNGVDPETLSFIIRDLSYFRMGFIQNGTSDTHSLSSVFYKGWRWETV